MISRIQTQICMDVCRVLNAVANIEHPTKEDARMEPQKFVVTGVGFLKRLA